MGAVIGQPVLRVDGADKSTGRLRFVCDTHLPDSLVGKIFRSPVPYGRVLYLDFEQARKVPGVHLVLGHEDVPRHRYNPIYNQQNPHTDVQVKDEVILDDVARYIGQPIALVVADTVDQAEEALSRIKAEWEEGPAVFDLESAIRRGAPEVRRGVRGNISLGLRKPDEPITLRKGEVEEGFAQADEVFEDVFKTQRVNQVALEPHLVCCWPETGNRVAVLSTTQSIFGLRARLSESLGLPLSTFRVIRPFLGGAFGKGLDMIANEALCALAALRLQRPVRIREHPSGGIHPDGAASLPHMGENRGQTRRFPHRPTDEGLDGHRRIRQSRALRHSGRRKRLRGGLQNPKLSFRGFRGLYEQLPLRCDARVRGGADQLRRRVPHGPDRGRAGFRSVRFSCPKRLPAGRSFSFDGPDDPVELFARVRVQGPRAHWLGRSGGADPAGSQPEGGPGPGFLAE